MTRGEHVIKINKRPVPLLLLIFMGSVILGIRRPLRARAVLAVILAGVGAGAPPRPASVEISSAAVNANFGPVRAMAAERLPNGFACSTRCPRQRRAGPCNSPSVLVPGLDLGVGEGQLGGQLHPVLDAQVLLPLEALLQGLELVVGERCPRLALLLGGRADGRRGRVGTVGATLILVACKPEKKIAKINNKSVLNAFVLFFLSGRGVAMPAGYTRIWPLKTPRNGPAAALDALPIHTAALVHTFQLDDFPQAYSARKLIKVSVARGHGLLPKHKSHPLCDHFRESD